MTKGSYNNIDLLKMSKEENRNLINSFLPLFICVYLFIAKSKEMNFANICSGRFSGEQIHPLGIQRLCQTSCKNKGGIIALKGV